MFVTACDDTIVTLLVTGSDGINVTYLLLDRMTLMLHCLLLKAMIRFFDSRQLGIGLLFSFMHVTCLLPW